ncbi:hypothetical protein BAE44_0020026, partial [Dichanthelium oligosanthes]
LSPTTACCFPRSCSARSCSASRPTSSAACASSAGHGGRSPPSRTSPRPTRPATRSSPASTLKAARSVSWTCAATWSSGYISWRTAGVWFSAAGSSTWSASHRYTAGTKKPIRIRPQHTTGEGTFAEWQNVCRVLFVGHSANHLFAECHTRQRKPHGKFILCRVPNTRHKKTLGKIYFA